MTKNELINIRAALDKASNWAHSQKDLFQMCGAKKLIEEELNRPSIPEGVEEAAVEYSFLGDIDDESYAYDTTKYEAFKAGAEFSAPRWISVEESLPPFDEEVIVLTDDLNLGCFYKICFGHIVNEGKPYKPESHNGWNIPGVKYWMPMPKVPNQK